MRVRDGWRSRAMFALGYRIAVGRRNADEWAYHCRNPRCRMFEIGLGPLCPSCRLAGSWGAGLAFLVGAALKVIGWI